MNFIDGGNKNEILPTAFMKKKKDGRHLPS